jgi:sulfate adenylyltransferase
MQPTGRRALVDNGLSPHGGCLIERVASRQDIQAKWPRGLAALPSMSVRDQIARECVNIAYGFFSPLEGFMGQADVDAVAHHMTLASGYIWSIPIVFDVSQATLDRLGVKPGDALLLTCQQQPLAVLEVADIYTYDKELLARQIYGTTDPAHPGVARTLAYQEYFLAGPLTLVNPPSITPPFDRFWLTPRQMRQAFAERGWATVAAFQTRNVPHAGHEWTMKGGWLAAGADGVLVNAVIGEKKPGDYIDEAIVLAHARLREAGFFRHDVHMATALLWDMRYAGPREAVFHALVRKNLGCTHHMFGRDHAGVGSYYDTYAAHRIFQTLPDLGIKPVLTLEWWYCPVCAGVAYEGLCGHREAKQDLSGTLIRRIIQGGVEPAPQTLRAEVLQVVRDCAAQYGCGSPFVTAQYLRERTPVLSMSALEGSQA